MLEHLSTFARAQAEKLLLEESDLPLSQELALLDTFPRGDGFVDSNVDAYFDIDLALPLINARQQAYRMLLGLATRQTSFFPPLPQHRTPIVDVY